MGDLSTDLQPFIGYDFSLVPALGDVGGEDAIVAIDTTEPDREGHVAAAAFALCASWSDLHSPVAATDWLRSAVTSLDVEQLIDFNDIVLACPGALSSLAATLPQMWSDIAAADGSLLGSVALEGWTRLALGGWCNTYMLRGALLERGEAARRGAAEADVFLVRALGAALDHWPARDLAELLEGLAASDFIEGDVASNVLFELGMSRVRSAVEAEDLTAAQASLLRASEAFDAAQAEGPRPDAAAFGAAVNAVASFVAGGNVSHGVANMVSAAAADWGHGYLGLQPHWRQPRADTVGWWSALVRDLAAIADLDEPAWWQPAALIGSVGRLYTAHNTVFLLAGATRGITTRELDRTGKNRLSDRGTATPGVAQLLAPRLDAGLGTDAKLQLVDRWLEEAQVHGQRATESNDGESGDQPVVNAAAVEAVRGARERLRAQERAPGKSQASGSSLPGEVREALNAVLDDTELAHVERVLEPLLQQHPELGSSGLDAGLLPVAAPTFAEHSLLNRLRRELQALLPDAFIRLQGALTSVLTALIRSVATTVDAEQGGRRAFPWHQAISEGRVPHESLLADHLAHDIRILTGLRALVEVPHMGGGRADVLFSVNGEQFTIEVKRITAARSDDNLVDEFGPQASQYTLTGVPFSFLAVLDLRPREQRLDINSSFWTRGWTVSESQAVRALTAMRVLATVKSPSQLSKSQPEKRMGKPVTANNPAPRSRTKS